MFWLASRLIIFFYNFFFFRIELEEVKARNSSVETSTASENAAKSLQWLLKSVNEIRTELNQLNSNLNLSGTAQQAEEFNKQINLIQVIICV